MSGKLIALSFGVCFMGYLVYLAREYANKHEQTEQKECCKRTDCKHVEDCVSEPDDFSDMYDDSISVNEDNILGVSQQVDEVDDLGELDDLDTLEDIDDSGAPIVNCEPVLTENIDKLMHDLQENKIQNKNKGISELPPMDDTELIDMSEFETLDKALSEQNDWLSDADCDSLF